MSRRRGGQRATPRMIFTPDGRMIERDPLEHEQWLVVHGLTPSGAAWIVSRDGREERTVPKVLLDVSEETGGGLERPGYDRERKRWLPRVVPIHLCSGPGFVFDEKGLRDVPAAA